MLAFTAPIRSVAGSDFAASVPPALEIAPSLKLNGPSAELYIQPEGTIGAQIFRHIGLQGSIPGEKIAERERRGFDMQLGTQPVRPIQISAPLQPRRGHFQKQFSNFRAALPKPPIHFHGKIGGWVGVALGQPPAMHSREPRHS